MVVRKWKFHLAGMMDAAIHSKIASLQIAKGILTDFLLNAPFTAVVDTKQVHICLETRNALLHVEIIIHKKHTGKDMIERHHAFTGVIA